MASAHKLNAIVDAYISALESIDDDEYHYTVKKADEGMWLTDEPNNLPGCEVYAVEVNYEHAMGSSQTTGTVEVIVTGFLKLAAGDDIGTNLRNFGQDIKKAIMNQPRLNLSYVIDTTYTAMGHDQGLTDRDRRVERGVEVHFLTRYTHDVDEP